MAWRIGRWLYLGSRRELSNEPDINGEYNLQRAWIKSQQGAPAPQGGFVVADVGANVGAWTANLIGEFKAGGVDGYRIWAFEPAAAQRADLSALCREAVERKLVMVDPRGLAAAPGKALFNVVGATAGTNALINASDGQTAGQTIEIDITTLDGLSEEQHIQRFDFVKVDTEGNDFNVILGAKGLFDREAIDILQFEYNWRWVGFERRLKQVFDFVAGRPYALGRLMPTGIEIYEAWHPELERYTESNYVIAHPRALASLPHWRAAFGPTNTPVTS